MIQNGKPKRALLAYCVLAERLRTPGVGIMQALTPFLAEACRQFAGELFDAQKFSSAVDQRYGISIPRLAALGLAEQLAKEGLLSSVSGHASSTVYRYVAASALIESTNSLPVTESEIDAVVSEFIAFCRSEDPSNQNDNFWLENEFLNRLLNVDSMKLLVRRDASITAKKTAATMILKKPISLDGANDALGLRLDFLVSQFLLDLRGKNTQAFERVSNIAFASMAAEAIACFREPPTSNESLNGLTVYLDSPLLLDMLGVNADYSEYGLELLNAIKASGAKPAVFDHCVAEAEGGVEQQLAYSRSGINQIASNWGTSAKTDVLAALKGNVGQRAESRLGIEVHRDPDVDLHRKAAKAVGSIESEMTQRMQAWRNEGAKEYDRKSVWAMLAIRDSTTACSRLCDSTWLMLSRNTPLVSIANNAWRTWLKGSTRHNDSVIERWVPIALSDKQFAGYLWARSGGGDSSISRTRLLAHCSAAVRPRADVKARAYNLVLELNGSAAADDVAALFEDREGARALMRATKGDPEDVTPERLPFILEQVKLGAGEFAAEKAREEAGQKLAQIQRTHDEEIERSREAIEKSETERVRDRRAADSEKMQAYAEKQSLAEQNRALQIALDETEIAESARRIVILRAGLAAGTKRYSQLRWAAAIFFGAVSLCVALFAISNPTMAALLSAIVGVAGFWFVPDVLNRPFSTIAMKCLVSTVKDRDPSLDVPLPQPDFRSSVWPTVMKE